MNKIQKLICILFFTLSNFIFANSDSIALKVDNLENLHVQIKEAEDTSKINLNILFKEQLLLLLQDYNSLSYDFKDLKSVSVLDGPNHQFRIYTWVLELGENNYDYFGFTQYVVNTKKKTLKITELINDFKLLKPEYESNFADKWLGGLYYAIVASPNKNDKKYLLLGWDGNSAISNKKTIEVIGFNKLGEPTFGAPILKVNTGTEQKAKYEIKHRVIFEYSEKSSMMLKYDQVLKMLVYDHLSPVNDGLKHIKASYVPDFSYDGFLYKSGKWIQQFNLDARNPKESKPKRYKPSDVGQ